MDQRAAWPPVAFRVDPEEPLLDHLGGRDRLPDLVDGKPYVDKGEILRIESPTVLVHTHWSDVSGSPDAPENYQEVTWALSERAGSTELTITEHNLPSEETKACPKRAGRPR